MSLSALGRSWCRSRNEATGIILFNAAVPLDMEKRRIDRLATQFKKAGLANVFVSGSPALPAKNIADLPVKKLSALFKSQKSEPIVMCPSHQYHLTSTHIDHLLNASRAKKACVEYDFTDTNFLAHMKLVFRAAAIYPNSANSDDLKYTKWSFGYSDTVFESNSTRHTIIPVTDDDVQSAYKVYTETAAPGSVIVELNSTCNFKCSYCPFHGDDTSFPHYVGNGNGKEMALEDFRDVISQVAEWKSGYEVDQATIAPFWRGEFFLSSNWEEALKIIRQQGLKSYVCSNASVLNDEIVEKITHNDYLDHLSISLEATTTELNELIRKNKKYDQIVRTIDRLLKLRDRHNPDLKIGLNYTVVHANSHIIRDYIEKWANKVDYVLIGPRNYIPPEKEQSVFEPWPEDMQAQVGEIPKRKVPCIFLFHTVAIDSDLNLQLCAACGSKRINIGNVKGRRIADVQRESELFQKVVKMHVNDTYMRYPYCATCQMRNTHFSVSKEIFGRKVHAEPASWVVFPKAS